MSKTNGRGPTTSGTDTNSPVSSFCCEQVFQPLGDALGRDVAPEQRQREERVSRAERVAGLLALLPPTAVLVLIVEEVIERLLLDVAEMQLVVEAAAAVQGQVHAEDAVGLAEAPAPLEGAIRLLPGSDEAERLLNGLAHLGVVIDAQRLHQQDVGCHRHLGVRGDLVGGVSSVGALQAKEVVVCARDRRGVPPGIELNEHLRAVRRGVGLGLRDALAEGPPAVRVLAGDDVVRDPAKDTLRDLITLYQRERAQRRRPQVEVVGERHRAVFAGEALRNSSPRSKDACSGPSASIAKIVISACCSQPPSSPWYLSRKVSSLVRSTSAPSRRT